MPGKPKARKPSKRDILEPSDDEERAEDQPALCRPPFRERTPTSSGSEGEPGSHNIPAQRQPERDLEPRPARLVCSEGAPVSETQPRPTKRLPAQRRPDIRHNLEPPPVRAVFSEDADNRDAPASESQPRPVKRLRVDRAQTPTVMAQNQDDHFDARGMGTNSQLPPPSTSHSTQLSHPGASRKRKQVVLDENEQEEHPARSARRLASESQVQQPMYPLSDQPGPLRARPVHHYQVPLAGPSYNNTEYPRYADYHDDAYRRPYNHFDAPQPRYQAPLAGPSNSNHPYDINHNLHHRRPLPDNYDYPDEGYTGLR